MCEPTTMLIAATAITAAGSVVGGINQNNQAKYQAQVANQNAALERNSANDARARGAIEEQRQYRRTAQLLGVQRAALASNGVEVDFGSAADLQTDTKTIGWEDAATIRENTVREARGFEINAYNDVAKGKAARAQGKAALIGGIFNAGSTILGGAQQYRKMKAGA